MNWRTRLIWFLFGFGGCLIFLILIPFRINPEFKAVDVLQLTVALFIALLIQYYGTQQYSDFRQAKNYLIEHIGQITGLVQEAYRLFMVSYIDQTMTPDQVRAILAAKREINNSVLLLEDALAQCKLQSLRFDDIQQLREQYTDALTDDPFPTHPYTPTAFSKVHTSHRKLTQALQTFRFEINSK